MEALTANVQDLDVTQWRIDELKITPKQKKKN